MPPGERQPDDDDLTDDLHDPDEEPSRELDDPREMTFLEHLEELRWTLLKCVGVLLAAGLLTTAFLKPVGELLQWPLERALGERELVLAALKTDSPMGVFSVLFQIVAFGALSLGLPPCIWFVTRFIAPGLTRRERRFLVPALGAAFGLFVLGASFSFFLLIPSALQAAFFLNDLLSLQAIWSADRYYSFLLWMTFGVGLAFEYPLVLLTLVAIGILDRAKLVAFRPYSVVVFLVVSALITPTTDPITFLLLAIPLSVLYEITILVAGPLGRRRAA